MKPVVILRPELGAKRTLAAASAAGLDGLAFPITDIVPCDWDAPDPAAFDGLLIGSANALRHAGPQLERYRGMPAYAVGAATMREAAACGLTEGLIGEGGLQAVIEAMPARFARLLRLAGRVHLPLEVPPHIQLETRVVYDVRMLPLPADAVGRLKDGAVVLLHSAETARHFFAECERLDLAKDRVALAALGPRIAEAAGSGWAEVRSAAVPRDSALLALASKMCHEGGSSRNEGAGKVPERGR